MKVVLGLNREVLSATSDVLEIMSNPQDSTGYQQSKESDPESQAGCFGEKGAICEETLGVRQNLLSSKNTQSLRTMAMLGP